MRPIVDVNRLEVLSAMHVGEGDVVRGVPILRQNYMFKLLSEGIDGRNNLIAILYRERSTGAEVILNIDHQESIGWPKGVHTHLIVEHLKRCQTETQDGMVRRFERCHGGRHEV